MQETQKVVVTDPPPVSDARGPVSRLAREMSGFLIVLAVGWGSLALLHFSLDEESPVAIAAMIAVDFLVFLGLEQRFWLSRFMGLQIYPSSTPAARALGLTLLGIIWLMIHAGSPPPREEHPKVEGPKDLVREVKETIVFVVVLVLLLKLFVAEAFVIPTGSMAETLRGDHARATCPQCAYKFVVSNSEQQGVRDPVTSFICPNCGYKCANGKELSEHLSSWSSGDRVLVSKFTFSLRGPHRFDVPVFKYPIEPYSPRDRSAMNYIKRLVGLGGETIAVYKGDLYVTRALTYPSRPRPPEGAADGYRGKSDLGLWYYEYMYPSDADAVKLFEEPDAPNGFVIVRKSPDLILAMRRIVFDLDYQPKRVPPTDWRRVRWETSPNDGAGWEMQEKGFIHQGGEFGWVKYRHLSSGWETMPDSTPVAIKDLLGYNARHPDNWVPDLIVECKAEITSDNAEVVLELNKGPERYQARFAGGECQLVRFVTEAGQEKKIVLGSKPSGISGKGTHHLRLANVDSRLTVWVDKKVLPFGDESSYPSPDRYRFDETSADSDRPVRIGAAGDVRCSKVQIWRDVYYTCSSPTNQNRGGQDLLPDVSQMPPCVPKSSKINVQTFYVQPDHYLMFGDNSASSSDSRSWGTVPERLLLGRAVVIYWPLSRIGVIE